MRAPEPAIDRVDVRQDQQHLSPDLAPQDRRHAVLVGHGVDAFEAEAGIGIDRRAAATARDDDVPGGHEVADHVPLDDADRYRAGRQPPPAAASRRIFPHGNAPGLEPRHLHPVERMADRLGGQTQVAVVRVAQRLRDHRDDRALDMGPRQRVLQRLLDHVAHPARGGGHQDTKRQRLHLIGGELVARQVVTDLGPVAVDQRDVPPGAGQVHDGGEALARVAELIGDGGPFPRRGDGVAAERDDD